MGISMDISMDIPMDIHEKICGYGCGYGWEISYPRQPCLCYLLAILKRKSTYTAVGVRLSLITAKV